MQLNEKLLESFRDAVEGAGDLSELDDIVSDMPDAYEEELGEEIRDRRTELSDTEMSETELIATLESNDHLRDALFDHYDLDAQDTEPADTSPEDSSTSGEESSNSGADSDGDSSGSADTSEDGVQDAQHDWEVGGDRDLSTTGSAGDEWDGDAAYNEILDWAEGEDGEVDQSQAKRGFAVNDASSDGQSQEDYKGPFATVEDGELKADMAGVDALDSMAGQMDVSDDVKDRVQSLVDSYKDDSDEESEDSIDPSKAADALQQADEITEDQRDDILRAIADEKHVVGEATLGTLRDSAEALGADLGEDPDLKDLVVAIDEAARESHQTVPAAESEDVGLGEMLDRLDQYGQL